MDKLLIEGGRPLAGEVRVSGAKRDDLQTAIQLIRTSITDIPLQFGNFRD